MRSAIQLHLFGDEKPESLSIEECANSLGVSSATIRNWTKTGYLEITSKGHHLSLLIAYAGKMFQVAEDLSVVETKQEYSAVGSGSDYALGALAVLQDTELEIKDKLKKSLQAANKFDLYTGTEFTFHEVSYG